MESNRIVALRAWIEARVAGQVWWYRAPLLLILAWMARGYLSDPMHSSIFGGLNLGFHEAGHAAFMWFGSNFWATAGGTIFEIGIPVAAGAYLLFKQRDPFGTAVCLFWLGTALFSVGIYAADARAQALPLVSPFGPVDPGSHDWTTMLMRLGRLSKDQEIGAAFQSAGRLAIVASLVLGAWVLWVMAHAKSAAGDGGALWDAAENERLAAFAKGQPVKRPHEDRRKKRMSEEERLREFLEKKGPE